MPTIHFDNLGASLERLPGVIKSIPDLMRDPSANPVQAAILLGIAVVLLLIILSTVILVIMRPSREEELLDDEYCSREYDEESGEKTHAAAPAAGEMVAEPEPKRPLRWLTFASAAFLLLVALWVAMGVTTSSSYVCTSCHAHNTHSVGAEGDPHAAVPCVACHEDGGVVARATVNLAMRVDHVVLAQTAPTRTVDYGKPVASDGCIGCHRSEITGTFRNQAQGVRMSHKEPLAAGATCSDCHVLRSGVLGGATVGMAPCLRCHDGKRASAACATCHIGDPSRAIRSTDATVVASVLVPNPRCESCHKDMSKCNACHGISMPHTTEFKLYGHARVAAIEIWNNGTRGVITCKTCHYPGHNDCVRSGCHASTFPGHPSPDWRAMHGLASWTSWNLACGCHQWNDYDHGGMIYCQVCHATKPKSARP